MSLALIDYRAGNLTSVRKALAHLGADVRTPERPADLARAGGVIVPGVGNFHATAALDEAWRRAIVAAIEDGRPMLGICLGMQWLFDASDEAPELRGLGLMPGTCRLIREAQGRNVSESAESVSALISARGAPPPRALLLDSQTLSSERVGPHPHTQTLGGFAPRIGSGLPSQQPRALKVPHVGWNSLHLVRPSWMLAGVGEGDQVYFTHSFAAPASADCTATTTYGVEFGSAVERGHVCGVQFHPEKSGDVGLRILSNFLKRVG